MIFSSSSLKRHDYRRRSLARLRFKQASNLKDVGSVRGKVLHLGIEKGGRKRYSITIP